MSKARRYNQGKRRWRNIPMYLLEPVITVGEYGEQKYATENDAGTLNYLKGLSVTDTLDSIKRHLTDFENPHKSDNDMESGLNHILHVAWNCIALYETLQRHPELDDRYKLSITQSDQIQDDAAILNQLARNELLRRYNEE